MIPSIQSKEAKEIEDIFSGLQVYFVSKINALALEFGKGKSCKSILWECDKGKHGKGKYYEARDKTLFNQLCVQVSHIEGILQFSATIHPDNPHVPSLHLSASWGKTTEGEPSWKLIADLDPAVMNESSFDKNIFSEAIKTSVGNFYDEGILKGDEYSFIPEVGRHRGVFHYCLEAYHTKNLEEGKAFVLALFETAIDAYVSIFSTKQMLQSTYTDEKKDEQLAYHTLYFFHLLMKDKDTISALLTCAQNNISVLASLPSFINRDILAIWVELMTKPQDELAAALLKVLPKENPTHVDEKTKKALANAVRKHYKKHPEALSMQASGERVPPTVDNHN